MRIALCQRPSIPNDVDGNLRTIIDDIETRFADVYIYPELFLTGYFHNEDSISDRLDSATDSLQKVSKKNNVMIIVGIPEFTDEGTYNCAYAFTPDSVRTYRKIHLPNFPPFDEKDRYLHGSDPLILEFKGFRFGLSICYDVFFPELMKYYSLRHSADVNICISASPTTSRTAFERVLPARAVENTTYIVYVNNIGHMGGLEFFGGSMLLGPNGDTLGTVPNDGVATFDIDKITIENARKMRPVLEDSRF